MLSSYLPLKGDKQDQRYQRNERNFTLEPNTKLGKSGVDFEVQGSLTVDEVTDLDTGYNHDVMPVVLLALVRWLGQPEEGKDEHNEAISHIVALLNHAVNELLNDEDQDHKERKTQVEHLLRLEVFTLSYISEPSSGL